MNSGSKKETLARSLELASRTLVVCRFVQRLMPRSNRASAIVLYLALTFPPLFFGSRSPFAVAAWCIILGFGLLICSTSHLSRGHWLALCVAGGISLAYCVVVALQVTVSLPLAHSPLWAEASNALGTPLAGQVSVVNGEPYFALGPPLANILALSLGIIVGNNAERARFCVRLTAYAGAAYALFGIVSHVVDPTHILWRAKTQFADTLTGTFVNRNTAATYFGSCAIIWLVLIMQELRRRKLVLRELSDYLALLTSKQGLFMLAMLFLCISALGMTNSRAGILLSFGALGLAALCYGWQGLTLRRALAAGATIMVAGLLFLAISAGGLHHRIRMQGLFDDEGRFAVYRSILDMIQQNPILGTGLGTFAAAFPEYRSRELSAQLLWDLGHNTYLETAAEVGLPLTALIALAWGAALYILTTAIMRAHRPSVENVVALCISLLALAHATVDFSLQINGYSIIVFGVLGIGLAQSVGPARSRSSRPKAA